MEIYQRRESKIRLVASYCSYCSPCIRPAYIASGRNAAIGERKEERDSNELVVRSVEEMCRVLEDEGWIRG